MGADYLKSAVGFLDVFRFKKTFEKMTALSI
jgi:hypothetical protein